MASSVIHLAIAKEYFKKHSLTNYEDFIAGTLYPDAASDNDKTHYTDKNRGNDNISHTRGKVNLYAFLKEHNSLNDFELGWFIHLITDYLFFKECFSKEYLKSISYETFYKDLYDAYECLNNYITEKYQITMDDYKAYPGEYYPGKEHHKCILKKEEIDHFINKVSSIDIDKYIKLIKKEKKNISFPDNII